MGPICGWEFNQDFGPIGGSITFTPGQALFETDDNVDFPGMTKDIPNPKTDFNSTSLQFNFQEYATPPNEFTTYQVYINSDDGSETLTLNFFGEGSVIVQVGPSLTVNNYSGTWAPSAGAIREAYVTVDALGVPRLFVDGVEIPLTFTGTGVSPSSLISPNTVSIFSSSADVASAESPVTSLFVTDGNPGPGTEFCCQ